MLEERVWVSQMGWNAVTHMVKEFSTGIAAATPVGETFLAMFEQVLRTNLTGVFFTIQPAEPQTEQEVPRRQLKTPVAQFGRSSVDPDAELFFDESLSRISSVDLKEIQLLSRFLPVIALIPRSPVKKQAAPRKIMVAKRSSESCDATKLLGVFGKAMERFKSTTAESMFAFGDVTVSFSEMEALRKGKPVVLTTLEFKTLKYLIQNARRMISRDELLNEVWGYENYPCTRTVDNHILRLRQKLERDPSRPVHFRTVHGAGYKFLP